MAVWLNMKGRDASLCASVAEGVEKMKGVIAKRAGQGAQITPTNPTVELGVRYIITSAEYGTEEFWLSDSAESKRA